MMRRGEQFALEDVLQGAEPGCTSNQKMNAGPSFVDWNGW